MTNNISNTVFEDENFDFESFRKEAIAGLKAGRPFLGKDGVATPLLKRILEASLEGEIEAHMAETKPEANRRNGKAGKTVKSDSGTFELETPRDRNGTFEPEIVKKRQTVLNASLDNGAVAIRNF
jgi:putative transposase